MAVVKAAIETIYTDGVDDLEAFHDPGQSTVWGTFTDGDKEFPYTLNYETGDLIY
jgi:hypothetical protein